MRHWSIPAAAVAALVLGPAAALAQGLAVAPRYHLEREYFHAGPAIPNGGESDYAPDQIVPSFTGEAHVPSNSVAGRGSTDLQLQVIAR